MYYQKTDMQAHSMISPVPMLRWASLGRLKPTPIALSIRHWLQTACISFPDLSPWLVEYKSGILMNHTLHLSWIMRNPFCMRTPLKEVLNDYTCCFTEAQSRGFAG